MHLIHSTHVQRMYMYIHSMILYMLCMYIIWQIYTCMYMVHTNQTSLHCKPKQAHWAWWEVKCGCEAVQMQMCLYYVHTSFLVMNVYVPFRSGMHILIYSFMNHDVCAHSTYINIFSCKSTYTFMNNKYIHLYIFMQSTYTFMNEYICMNMV